MSETTELTIIEPSEALTVFEPERVDEFLKTVRERALSQVSDPETASGRKEMRSMAYEVSRTKTHIVKLANQSIEEARAKVRGVTTERIRIENYLNDLRDEVRAPAVEWELKEKARIDRHESDVRHIADHSSRDESGELRPSAGIKSIIGYVEDIAVDESFEEYQQTAAQTKSETLERLKADLALAEQRESEQAELERLRKEKQEAEAREQARLAEERRLKEEAERIEREKQEAIKAKQEAEKRERETQERIKREREAAAKAERERIERERREEEARKAAEAKAVRDAEDKRQADEKHRNSVRQAAILAIRQFGMHEANAEGLVNAIEHGEIPHVSINF